MAQWCLDFDGSNDYVSCGDVPTGALQNLTVECWMRIDADESGGIISKWGTLSSDQEWKLEINSKVISWSVSCVLGENEDIYVASSSILDLDTWHHVAGVYDADSNVTRLYVNGICVESDTAALQIRSTTQVMELGRLSTDYASIRLGWVRISDSARYDASFDVPKSPPFVDAHTLVQYDFIEATGATLNNREGESDYDGVITGATWRYDAPERSDLWGSSYQRFGDEWTILVDDVDITQKVALDSIEVVLMVGSNLDTAVFRVENVLYSDVSLCLWNHVQIWHGGSIIFGGFLVAFDKFVDGYMLDIVCHCVDWGVLLSKRVVADDEVWTDATAGQIIDEVIKAGYVPEIESTTYIDAGATGLDVSSSYQYVNDLVQQLADASDYYYFVREDEEGDVYLHFSADVVAAPFSLSTSPDLASSLPLRVLQWSESGSDIINDFYILSQTVSITNITNASSIAAYGTLSAVVKSTDEHIALYNQTYLDSLANPRISGRIEIFHAGIYPGMSIDIVHSPLNIDDTYLVQTVRCRPLGGSAIRCELLVATSRLLPTTSIDAWRRIFSNQEFVR